MPVTKRTSKTISYKEEDDDDDFISINDKNRLNKSNTVLKEPKSAKVVTKQSLEKHEEKSVIEPKPEEIEPIESPVQSIIENNDDKENSDGQSAVSSHGSSADQDESLSPKTKRIKHEEDEKQSVDTNIAHNHTTRITDVPKRNSSIPLGFPTDKIKIASPHTSRVGLSRKSATIKPLHPNFVARTHSE